MKYDARACHFNMDTGCVELLLRDVVDVQDSEDGTQYVMTVKQKTAYEIGGSDWSSDVCSSDLAAPRSRYPC